MESGVLSFVTGSGVGRIERKGEGEATAGEISEWSRAGIIEWITRSAIDQTGLVMGSSGETRIGMGFTSSNAVRRSSCDDAG